MLAEIPSGRWTTYGEVAVVVGSHPVPVGQAIANHPMPNPWRVLNAGGTLSAQFRWTDQHRTDDPRDLLRAEGVHVDVAGRADPERFMDAVELAAGMGLDIDASTLRSVLDPAPARLRYFGDLDVAGLRAAVGAANAARTAGYPPLQPAASLYRTLLEVGVPAADDSHRGSVNLEPLLDWLPADIRPPAAALLAAHQKHAQEAVGLDLLITRPVLLAHFAS